MVVIKQLGKAGESKRVGGGTSGSQSHGTGTILTSPLFTE